MEKPPPRKGCPRGCGNESSQVALGQGLGTKNFVSAPAPPEETKGNESPTPSTRSKAPLTHHTSPPDSARRTSVRAAQSGFFGLSLRLESKGLQTAADSI